ncbi:MAG: type II toxin-antitoxin system HicB family antitoxin [Candidatus Geothermarchaeales archaeon]
MSKTKARKFTVVLREEEVGGFSVQCLELPGAISQGETREEALRNIKEGIEGYLEAFPEEAERLKLKREVVEVTF